MSYFGNRYYFDRPDTKFPIDLRNLQKCKPVARFCDYLFIKEENTSGLLQLFQMFESINAINLSIKAFSEDLENDIVLPQLEELEISTPIPMEFKRIWNVLRNLTEITIGSNENPQIYTSAFINRLIKSNRKTLRKLTFMGVLVEVDSYKELDIPLNVEVFKFQGVENKNKQFICSNLLAKNILELPGNLKDLEFEKTYIDDDLFSAIARNLRVRRMTITNSTISIQSLSDPFKEFITKLQLLNLSDISSDSCPCMDDILRNLKDIEVLKLSSIGRSFKIIPTNSKIKLENLKELSLNGKSLTQEIFEAFTLSEKLEILSCEISDLNQLNELLEHCPNITEFRLQFAEKEFVHFIIKEFKLLRTIEVNMQSLCKETVILILKKSGNIRRAKIFTSQNLNYLNSTEMDNKMKQFPGFTKAIFDEVVEIYNREIFFRLTVCPKEQDFYDLDW